MDLLNPTGRGRVTARGTWPQPVTFRRGFARADARRWNSDFDEASLRVIRGGTGFLESCTHALLDLGVPAVMSPPLSESSVRPWLDVSYERHTELALMRIDLYGRVPTPDHLVLEGNEDDLDRMLEIDCLAFPAFWRFDRDGLVEAINATDRSTTLVIRDDEGEAIGFAVVGFGHAISYLQRVAVDPRWQGQRMGRSLVRVAARKARAEGATAMLLNTQFENDRAIGLYQSEGFELLSEPLQLLRRAS